MEVLQTDSLARFHEFVGSQLASEDAASLSPDRVLELWHERENSLAAIRAGLEDIERGRSVSLETFDQMFRQRHGIPADK